MDYLKFNHFVKNITFYFLIFIEISSNDLLKIFIFTEYVGDVKISTSNFDKVRTIGL